MKSLVQFLNEEGESGPAAGGIYATPGNTIGTGNPSLPIDGGVGDVGSGDFIGPLKRESKIKIKKRKKKRLPI